MCIQSPETSELAAIRPKRSATLLQQEYRGCRAITVSDRPIDLYRLSTCPRHVCMPFNLSIYLSDAKSILIRRGGCTVGSAWQSIKMWVICCGTHQRRIYRREELEEPAVEQRVKYLQKTPGRSKGRLCIKPAAVSSNWVLNIKSSPHLFLHMWV